MQSNILVDWITFSSKADDFVSITEFLGLQSLQFTERSGRYFYRRCRSFGNINIYSDGINDDMGVCVEMSGQGCRDFETYGKCDWMVVFAYILNNDFVNISRLDVAFDDFDGALNLDAIIQDTFDGNFTSKFSHWNVQKGSRGATVEHGTRGGSMYIRIYDKKAERKREDLEHWVRCELQMREQNALGFITSLYRKESFFDLSGESVAFTEGDIPIGKLFFQVLNNYLRYVEPDDSDSNMRRWPTAAHWLRFLDTVERRSIFISPGTEYNVMNLSRYIFHQAGNAINTYIELMGQEKFLNELKEVKKSKNPKYDNLRRQYMSDSQSDNTES